MWCQRSGARRAPLPSRLVPAFVICTAPGRTASTGRSARVPAASAPVGGDAAGSAGRGILPRSQHPVPTRAPCPKPPRATTAPLSSTSPRPPSASKQVTLVSNGELLVYTRRLQEQTLPDAFTKSAFHACEITTLPLIAIIPCAVLHAGLQCVQEWELAEMLRPGGAGPAGGFPHLHSQAAFPCLMFEKSP